MNNAASWLLPWIYLYLVLNALLLCSRDVYVRGTNYGNNNEIFGFMFVTHV